MFEHDNTTLVVKHLPPDMTKEEKEDLLKFFGAVEVKCLSSEVNKTSLVFARFNSKTHASQVMQTLHQISLHGHLLSVEYARARYSLENEQISENKNKKLGKEDKPIENKLMDSFINKLNSWCNDLDFNLPPPVHLKYAYPPPSFLVLKNICKALSKVPKLYTQVLHLMNKMNLPCPFVEDYKIEDPVIEELQEDDLKDEIEESEEESELEDEGFQPDVNLFQGPLVKEVKKTKLKRPRKLIGGIKTAPKKAKTEKMMKPEEIFEKPKHLVVSKKPIAMNLPPDLISVTSLDTSKAINESEGFEIMETEKVETPVDKKEETINEEQEDTNKIITEEELSSNRIPPKDFHLLPVFKNYQPGLPSCRLYIKNLGKTVQTSDLNFIYKKYFLDENEEQGSMFDIRLMQEGRMKGQAFVTLQNVSLAEKALKETNGFLLKGKPMVVQYARSSKAK